MCSALPFPLPYTDTSEPRSDKEIERRYPYRRYCLPVVAAQVSSRFTLHRRGMPAPWVERTRECT